LIGPTQLFGSYATDDGSQGLPESPGGIGPTKVETPSVPGTGPVNVGEPGATGVFDPPVIPPLVEPPPDEPPAEPVVAEVPAFGCVAELALGS